MYLLRFANARAYFMGKSPLEDWMIPTMTPNMPRAEPKISTINILTKREELAASARAQLDPDTPTHHPDAILVKPTLRPLQKTQYPAKNAVAQLPASTRLPWPWILPFKITLMMIPYMAVASQKIIEIRFFVLMRGLFTDAPMSVLPVTHIPQAAPITENANENATPKYAKPYGLMFSRISSSRRYPTQPACCSLRCTRTPQMRLLLP